MKKLRPALTPSSLAPVATPASGPIAAWVRFWFTPEDPFGLHLLRMLAGVVFLCFWLLPLAGQRVAFFGLNGWFDLEAYREAARFQGRAAVPIPSWSLLYRIGTDPTVLTAVYWLSVAVLALFTLGVLPRLTAILTWVVVASFTWNPAVASEVDGLLLLLAFYLMAAYVLYGLRSGGIVRRLIGPLAVWPLGGRRDTERPSLAANLALRLLQVHFALVLVVSGLHKLQSGDWWAGVAFWYPLHSPFTTTPEMLREEVPHAATDLTLYSLSAYATMAWQIGFPLFAWRPRWRVVLLTGAALAWVGSALIFGQPLFGPAILVGCLSYVTAREWRRVLGFVPGLNRERSTGTAEKTSTTLAEPAAALVGGRHS